MTTSLAAVDRSTVVAGYTSCLLDCITDLWKRVYDYACALFAYLFGSPAPEPAREAVRLPASIAALISEYVFDAENHTEILHIVQATKEGLSRPMPPGPLSRGNKAGHRYTVQERIYELHFQAPPLVARLITLKRLADCFDAPQLMDKVVAVFRRNYYLELGENEGECGWKKMFAGMRDLYQFIEGKNEHMSALHVTSESDVFFPLLANLWKVTVPEAEQIVTALKELIALPQLKIELDVNRRSERQTIGVPQATLLVKKA